MQRLPFEAHLAPIRLREPGDHPQKRALSRSAGPKQRHSLTTFDRQIDPVKRSRLAEPFDQPVDFEKRAQNSPQLRNRARPISRNPTAATTTSSVLIASASAKFWLPGRPK